MTEIDLSKILGINIEVKLDKNCWVLVGTDWSNYANYRKERLHRVVYQLCIGSLIAGREVCHKCDRKGCFNPDHLFQGTHSQNIHDAFYKGRLRSGLFNLRLTESKEMKELRERDRWKQLRRFAGE